MASLNRLGVCAGCRLHPARYTCPSCDFRSCSVACSAQHKVVHSCSGVASPVWSRPLQANEMTWGSLMRDQSYIAGVGRAVEGVGKQLVADRVIPQGRGTGRIGAEAEAVRLDERSDKEDRMVREARNEGVELVLLPKGMSKRLKNGTRWDPKNNRLEWTVEVAFQPRPSSSSGPTVITTVPHASTSPLYIVLTSALTSRDKKGKGKEVSPEDAEWLMKEKAWVETLKPVKGAKAEKPIEESVKPEPEAVVGGVEEPSTPEEADEATALPEAGPSSPPPTTANPPPAPKPDEAPTIAAVDDDSPFILLLTFYRPPPSSFDSSHSSSSNPNLVQPTLPAPSSSSAPSRPAGRPVYLISSPSLTLRAALEGTTILENPLFELWSREAFLRQKALGKIEVVGKPSGDSVRSAGGGWEGGGRGRGRGRGRGGAGGRGGGRGGYGGGREEGEREQGGGGRAFESRGQDSGWGKRGPPAPVKGEGGEEKRPRLESQIDAFLQGE
ncbi:hypothetical protein JCM8547_008620 [Rhodosporidiobolus lusitaniae]